MVESNPHPASSKEMASDTPRTVEEGIMEEPVGDGTGVNALDEAHFDDPNLNPRHMIMLEDESPYPEVRSAVANTDDPGMNVDTLRAWILGLVCAIIVPGFNQFFSLRLPSIGISGLVVQLLTFPVGHAWAAYIPRWRIMGVNLNPGPFTVKEHVLITIMVNIGITTHLVASAFELRSTSVAVQRVYYGQVYDFGCELFVVMSTQLIGFSVGGIASRFLVAPPSMIWPANLVACVVFNTLHSRFHSAVDVDTRGGLSRQRFFLYALFGSFAWLQALSFFSWVTWFRPNNPTIAQMFGYVHGMGMSIITLDWNQIAFVSSPLATPWWAQANVFGGFVFFFWFLVPILYFSNTWYAKFMPISSRTSYDNQMNAYNISKILTAELTIDLEAYHKYSPLFMSLSFASITATLTHTMLFFRKQISLQMRRTLSQQPDIHARLMSEYPQVPEWWYAIIFLSMCAFGIISVEVWPTQMPVWAFALAVFTAFVYVIPVGMILAITNQEIALNVVTELIIGYALPGHPLAMMLFKTWGYITMAQALAFTSNFKLGHYMKIPPRTMFWGQIAATVIAGTVQLGVQAWMFTNIDNLCSPGQKDRFVCPSTEVFGTASIIINDNLQGLIGPGLIFSKGQTYKCGCLNRLTAALLFFLVGAVAPLVGWTLTRTYPNGFLRYLNPLIFAGTSAIPPATALNYVPAAWIKYNCKYFILVRFAHASISTTDILAAALDAGVAFCFLVIFFALELPKAGTIGTTNILQWWGNTVPFTGADYGPNGAGTPVQALAPGESFGFVNIFAIFFP
ncbi:small oligopeptide transporter [Mycena galopus ATCC 62051]|nr:small oligopeptide transporter [Mycena galopus ATCC 62051]